MELKDLFPSKPEFTLSSTGKTYSLRIPNLEDRAKFREWFGTDDNIQKVFNELQWDVIAKLVFRLLEQKSEFEAVKEAGFDDDGVKVTYLVTGPAMLMRAVMNTTESMSVLTALISALRAGDPLIDKAMKDAFEDNQKKNDLNQTGENSLTLSHLSTGTLQNSLANLQ